MADFWNEDGWFLFARDYLESHINSDDSVSDVVRKSVDLFEKPWHWKSQYRDWQELEREPEYTTDSADAPDPAPDRDDGKVFEGYDEWLDALDKSREEA